MKEDRIGRLLDMLRDADSWVPASAISRRLGTSERTVRTYVKDINRRGLASIDSSRLGYRLAERKKFSDAVHSDSASTNTKLPTPGQRVAYVLARLVNAPEPVSIFDLADEMGVSESTVQNTVMPKLRRLLARFDLELDVHDFSLELTGNEVDLRHLIGHAAMQGGNGYFSSPEILEAMFPNYDVQSMLEQLTSICQQSGLFLNNYALSNLLMHLAVIMIRLQSPNTLTATLTSTMRTAQIVENLTHADAIQRCADEIQAYASRAFGVHIGKEDYRQIIVLLALSTETYSYDELSRDRLVRLVGAGFFEKYIGMVQSLRDQYDLVEFDETFLLQFALHVHNAYQRTIYGASCPNPIANQLKQDYAAVYDMGVYFAHLVRLELGISFSDDEIGFLAFHLGAYIEQHKKNEEAASCIVIFERYHDYASNFLQTLEEKTHGELSVIGVLNAQEYLAAQPSCDLVITTIGFPRQHPHTVLVSPLLSARNVRKIRDELDEIAHEHRANEARTHLQEVMSPELYLRNLHVSSATDCIQRLGDHCIAEGVATPELIDDILTREHLSNTAFTDLLAVPHPITVSAQRSFACVLHNDEPIPWNGSRKVNFVVMIGMTKGDTPFFQDILDLVIDLFLSPEKSQAALRTDSYEEFVRILTT